MEGDSSTTEMVVHYLLGKLDTLASYLDANPSP